MTQFKVGDKVRITDGGHDTFLKPAIGRKGVVIELGTNEARIEFEGEPIGMWEPGNKWWFRKDGLVLTKEEEEKVVTKFEVGEKVRLLPGARSTADSPEHEDKYADGHRVDVIRGEIDCDGDYFLSGIGYVGAEFLAKFDEFPREISFADVKVGDRISARRETVDGEVTTLEGTVRSVESESFFTENWYVTQSVGWVLTLLARPEPEFTSEQYAAVEALEAAGFSRESAEEIVKKGDSA